MINPMKYKEIKKDRELREYIARGNEKLGVMGYTDHSEKHCILVAERAGMILKKFEYPEHTIELAKIAGFMHDIGNVVNRIDHAQSGAIMAFRILDKWGMDPADTALVVTAIGNHDEHTAFPVNAVSAALILADKTDVRRSRVRQKPHAMFDIHDRVNYSVTESRVELNTEKHEFTEILTLDTAICPVLEYFEIFMERMLLCQKAAAHLGLSFRLRVNGQNIL